MDSFIFGGSTSISNPEELARRRALSAAILARQQQPKNLWEGLNSLATSIGERNMQDRYDTAEKEGKAGAAAAYQPVVDALVGKGRAGNDVLTSAMGNEWLSTPQQKIVSALLSQNMEADAPLTKWQQAQIDLDRQKIDKIGASSKYGLNPVWGLGPNGETQLFQLPQAGGAPVQVQFPQGFKPTPGVSYQNLGTSVVGMDNKSGLPVSQMPIDVAGKAAEDAKGEARGKAEAAAPGDYQAAQNALDLITDIRNDPNKALGTGFSSYGNLLRGTPGYDFQNKVEQAKSGAFLTAIQQMRGLGALSNAEGSAATAAVNRMNTATSEAEFNAALDDYEKIVRQGMDRAAKRGGAPASNTSQNAAPQRLKFNPATGDLE